MRPPQFWRTLRGLFLTTASKSVSAFLPWSRFLPNPIGVGSLFYLLERVKVCTTKYVLGQASAIFLNEIVIFRADMIYVCELFSTRLGSNTTISFSSLSVCSWFYFCLRYASFVQFLLCMFTSFKTTLSALSFTPSHILFQLLLDDVLLLRLTSSLILTYALVPLALYSLFHCFHSFFSDSSRDLCNTHLETFYLSLEFQVVWRGAKNRTHAWLHLLTIKCVTIEEKIIKKKQCKWY